MRISLINIDLDFYEPTKVALDCLYSHVSRGGVVILDDYGSFQGANNAIDEFFGDKSEPVRKLPFAGTPSYIIKP